MSDRQLAELNAWETEELRTKARRDAESTTPTTAPVGEGTWTWSYQPGSGYRIDGKGRQAVAWAADEESARVIVRALNATAPTLARVVELEGALRGLLDCETNLNGCSGVKLLDAVDAARSALAGKMVGE